MKFFKIDGGRVESGYSFEGSDCVVRAISVVTGRGYRWAHDLLRRLGRKPREGFELRRAALAAGMIRREFFTRRSAAEAIRILPKRGRFILCTSTHAFAILNGALVDRQGICREWRLVEAWEYCGRPGPYNYGIDV